MTEIDELRDRVDALSENLSRTMGYLLETQDVVAALVSVQFELLRMIRDHGLIEEPAILSRLQEARAVLSQVQARGQAASLVAGLIGLLTSVAHQPVQQTQSDLLQAAAADDPSKLEELLEKWVPRGQKN